MTTMNAKRWMMAAMAAVLVIGLSACSDAGVTAPANETTDAYSMISIPNPDMTVPDQVVGGTLDQDFAIERPGSRERRQPFGHLLRAMKLNETQLAAAKDCIAALEACMKEGMAPIREQQQELMAGFRAQRKAIIDEVVAGTMSREDAAAALKALHAEMREAMAPLHEQAKAVAEGCKTAFFDCLRALPELTADQLAVLERWIAMEGKGGRGEGGDDHGGRGPGGGRRG